MMEIKAVYQKFRIEISFLDGKRISTSMIWRLFFRSKDDASAWAEKMKREQLASHSGWTGGEIKIEPFP